MVGGQVMRARVGAPGKECVQVVMPPVLLKILAKTIVAKGGMLGAVGKLLPNTDVILENLRGDDFAEHFALQLRLKLKVLQSNGAQTIPLGLLFNGACGPPELLQQEVRDDACLLAIFSSCGQEATFQRPFSSPSIILPLKNW
jgi:hypothetical protein